MKGDTISLWALKIGGVLLALLYIILVSGGYWSAWGQTFVHLLLGGLKHAWHGIPFVVSSGTSGLGMVACLAVTIVALHFLLRSLTPSPFSASHSWRLRWTLSSLALLLILFATTCASVGILHHTAWMFRGKVIHDVSRGIITQSMHNVRQLVTALHIYASDHGEKYPEKLEALVTAEILEPESLPRLNQTHLPGEIPLPFIYLAGLSASDPGDLPLLVTPYPFSNGRYGVAYNDSSVDLVTAEKYEADLQRWRKFRMEKSAKPDAVRNPELPSVSHDN